MRTYELPQDATTLVQLMTERLPCPKRLRVPGSNRYARVLGNLDYFAGERR